MLNNVVLFAKVVTDEIELRKSKSDVPVTEFRVVHTNKRAKHPLFIDVEVWGFEASKAHENIKKGNRVIIYGELRPDVWTSKEGEKRSKIKIVADREIISENTRTDEEPDAF